MWPELIGETTEQGRENATKWLSLSLDDAKEGDLLTENQAEGLKHLSETIRSLEGLHGGYVQEHHSDDFSDSLEQQIDDLKDVFISLVEDVIL